MTTAAPTQITPKKPGALATLGDLAWRMFFNILCVFVAAFLLNAMHLGVVIMPLAR